LQDDPESGGGSIFETRNRIEQRQETRCLEQAGVRVVADGVLAFVGLGDLQNVFSEIGIVALLERLKSVADDFEVEVAVGSEGAGGATRPKIGERKGEGKRPDDRPWIAKRVEQ